MSRSVGWYAQACTALVLLASASVGCSAASNSPEDIGTGGSGGSSGTGNTSSGGDSGSGGSQAGTAGQAGASGSANGGTGMGATAGSAGQGGMGGANGGTGGISGTGGIGGSGGMGGSNGFGGANMAGTSGSSGASGAAASAGTSGTAGSGGCNAGDSATDNDGDGYSENDGDCNDCDPIVHPGAIDGVNYVDCTAGTPGCVCDANNQNCKVIAPPEFQVDESCGHTATGPCDMGLALDDVNAQNGAKAIDICATVANNGYGVISASYVRVDGSALDPAAQVGLMSQFGDNVPAQVGSSMLVLSSGRARTPGQANACSSNTCLNHGTINFPGYPQNAPGCPIANSIRDDVALELHLKAPSNATGFRFKFKFHSFEYAEYVCNDYNDQFLAWMNPPPMGAMNGNISFDSNNNPVSVNVAYFDVCPQETLQYYAYNCIAANCPSPPMPYCPSGPNELVGTGFDVGNDAGATSWLYTTAPVTGGQEFTLRFAIWDTGDSALDSTVLIDGFEWIADGTTVVVNTGKIE